MTVNEKIIKVMEEMGTTKKRLSEYLGMSEKGVGNMLDAKDLKFSQLSKIAEFFRLPVSYFTYGSNSDNLNMIEETSHNFTLKDVMSKLEDLSKRVEKLEKNNN